MDNQNNIQDELRGMDSGLPVSTNQPFSVPEGYFDGLAAQILAKAKGQEQEAARELQELSPLLAGLSKTMPYSVPEGYFELNLELLPGFVAEEKASPVLAGIGKTLPYQVPQGYFDTLPQQVLSRLNNSQAKVVPLFARTWMRVAVAALIGGAVFFGGYQLVNRTPDNAPVANVEQPADTTQSLVARNEPAPVMQDMKNVSTEELDAFIKTVPLNATKKQRSNSANPASSQEVDNLLKNISTKEMDLFLEQIPTADADLLVID